MASITDQALALDRIRKDTVEHRRAFSRVRRAELQFARRLRGVAQNVGGIVKGFPPGDPGALPKIEEELRRYSAFIGPWAKRTAERMLLEVSRRDQTAWKEYSQTMARVLHKEIQSAPTGAVLRKLLGEQVTLITSLPLEAGQRVHELTLRGLETGARSAEIAQEILRTGEVTKNRANTIARTEVGRTASGLVQARSVHVGSEGYIWRTAGDSDVRPSHRAMEGKFVAWDDPPVLDGFTGHAGCDPNCRCYSEPIVPDEL